MPRLSFSLYAVFLVATPAMLSGQALPAQTPVRITLPDFQRLRWIVGSWRGSGGNYPSFYEEYSFVNDSTLRRRTFTDSTFTVVDDSARFEWRGGSGAQVRGGRAYPITKLTGDTVRYQPPAGSGRGGSMWVRISASEWKAILDPASPGGAPTIYVLRRIAR